MKSANYLHLILVTLIALIVFTPQAMFAGQPVDPSTLNPPPPPEFNPVCEKDGNQTICTLQFSDPPFAGGSGVICGTGPNAYEVFQFQNRTVQGLRYYDQNGNLTRRHFHEVDTGTFSNSITNNAVSFTQRGTTLHDLAIPGDLNSGTQIFTGSARVYQPHGGSVLLETGRIVSAGDGTLLRESGQHPFTDYFVLGDTAAVQPLCDALQ